ncbi:hypothetical protein BAUCODRAFT_332995 [Baudoinia panamericana UAMH 10762]|uniref:Uncharacterized protein n=1 Tax=Baudoinia panamericana (strain UAMH 10762) TaxID=717646 RepID=M2MXN9_BAUPA|nr:uncharacterized protein BAUCODRAFT_332995 [Baudoinia panamericana UAMH 10762]EMC91000.1 hypothetical protein BAUCODRAFT_332995 [Baudoinia panamericana UAMH 10762]
MRMCSARRMPAGRPQAMLRGRMSASHRSREPDTESEPAARKVVLSTSVLQMPYWPSVLAVFVRAKRGERARITIAATSALAKKAENAGGGGGGGGGVVRKRKQLVMLSRSASSTKERQLMMNSRGGGLCKKMCQVREKMKTARAKVGAGLRQQSTWYADILARERPRWHTGNPLIRERDLMQ